MHLISIPNVHTALPKGIDLLRKEGIWTDTRNGLALTSPYPVTTHYFHPKERVIFWPERDANPFFHIYEAMWMLLGRNDVESVAGYAKQMREYSDDLKTIRGAYGHRWRNWFDTDNLALCIKHLKDNPNSRRVVLPMFDPCTDTFNHDVKDIPCNLVIHFRQTPAHQGHLDMTVFCRSNDIVWGAYGANAAHFSFLQEYVATCVGMDVGQYWQVSDDFHIYKPQYEKLSVANMGGLLDTDQPLTRVNPYLVHTAPTHPLMSTPEGPWLNELARCLDQKGKVLWEDPFIGCVLAPILRAHEIYKTGEGEDRYVRAGDELNKCANWDWHQACRDWINRRYAAWARAKDDGVNYE